MAERLQREGWRVFGTSRRARTAFSGEGPKIEWIQMDVCHDESVEAGLATLFAGTPHLDALVCNAGWGIFGSVEETSIERARAQLETNYFGVLRVLRPLITHMRERRSGRILLVGSLAGRAPIPFQAHYSASKAAIEALVLALANELHAFDVYVGLIEPGDIDTPFNDGMDWGEPDGASPYAEQAGRTELAIREALPLAPGPGIVADAVAHALGARRPRVRYAVGREAWLVGLGRRLLTDRLSLRIIRDHFGL